MKLRFLTSNTFIAGNEKDLCKHFNLSCCNVFFPQSFLSLANLQYIGTPPDFSYYANLGDSNEEQTQKLKNYRLICLQLWNLKKELVAFASTQLHILITSLMLFLKECFQFQISITTQTNRDSDILLNPFNSPICTLGGLIYRIFKFFYLNHSNVYAIKDEFGKGGKFISRLEHQYVSYIQYCNPDKSYEPQYYFKQAIPDLFCFETGTALFVHGCHWHSCLDSECTVNKNCTPESLNFQGKTFKSVQEEFDSKIQKLMANNLNVQQVDVVWECQIKRKMKEPHFAAFLKDIYIYCPLEPLIPRKCYRGALIDNYQLRWAKLNNPNDVFYFLDVNGLYAHVSMKNKFMVGKYEILKGRTLMRLEIKQNLFYVDGIEVMGSAQVTILPPKCCLYPFLMYRAKNNKVFNTLCKLCCENGTILCKHSDTQRALIGCYMLTELTYALKLGYSLLHIHECHVYKESDFILKDFTTILTSMKTRYSNLWSEGSSNQEKQQRCDFLNQKMNLNGELQINIQDKFNASKRLFYKSAQNSFFGKFGQKTDFHRTLFLTDQSQIDSLVNGKEKIQDIYCPTPNLCIAEIQRNPKLLPPNRNSSCYISSQITAFSRQFIHEQLLILALKSECKIISIDCDSIMFTLPAHLPCPLQISDACGDFKNEIDAEIVNYFSLGPKNYVMICKSNDSWFTVRKISGLALPHHCEINPQLYETFLDNYVKNIFNSKTVSQKKRSINLLNLTINSESSTFTLSNIVSVRRIVDKSHKELKTVPYGFKN